MKVHFYGTDSLQCQCVKVHVCQADPLWGSTGSATVEDHSSMFLIIDRVRKGNLLPCTNEPPPQKITGAAWKTQMLLPLLQYKKPGQMKGKLILHPGGEDNNFLRYIFQSLQNFFVKHIQSKDGLAGGKRQIIRNLILCRLGMNHIGNQANPVQRIKTYQSLWTVGHADGHYIIPLKP